MIIGPVLKPFTYLQLLDVADHLKIKTQQLNAPGSPGLVAASLVLQDLTYTSKLCPGTQGNGVQIVYEDSVQAGEESASMASNGVLTVKIKAGVTTAAQIKALVENNWEANRWLYVVVSGTGSNAQAAAPLTSLAGGTDATGYDAQLYRRVVKFMNAACDWFEQEIDGPVLTREFTGVYDGSNSNVVRPEFHPVKSITSLKIDYNRQFAEDSKINPTQYFIRGPEDVKQIKGSSTELSINGSDIVLRDDNETFIVGRIFSGSILGSIELKYTAGLGTVDTLPEDLVQASLQLVEYWYFQRENRDIGVTSRGVQGQSYTKPKDDIPDEIVNCAQKYTDFSFPQAPVPQRNYFRT